MAKKSMHEEIQKIWELSPIWNLLTEEEKEYVDQFVTIHYFRKNQIIHHEGDYPTHMMMLVKGKVRVYKEGVSNRNQIIRLLKPYDFFGYRAIIANDENGYNTSVSAFEESVVYMVKKEAFMHLIQNNLPFCYAVMVEMARDLGHSDSRTVSLTQKHIRGRLAEALLSLQQRYGYDEDEATIAMYMSREDLANLSNMTTANAIRTLSNFADEGLISIDGRKIKILDIQRLSKLSQHG